MPAKTPVVLFVSSFFVGGSEHQTAILAKALQRAGVEVHLACFHRVGPLLADMEAARIPCTVFPITSLKNLASMRERLRFTAFLRRMRPAIVHAVSFYPNVFAIAPAVLAGAPVTIASIRDIGDIWSQRQRRVQRLSCRLARCVFVNSDAGRQRLVAEGYDAEKIAVIPNGIPVERFDVPRPCQRVRRELGLPPDAPVVAAITRLHRVKGLEYFIEAAALLRDSHPAARFLIVGSGTQLPDGTEVTEYRRELEALAAQLGVGDRVTFTGFRRDTPEILASVQVSVLPSLSEGLSNTLIESLCAGVPTVATRVGGNPEVIDDGVSGLLVPDRSAQALADGISRLLGDAALAGRLGDTGKRRGRERFSVDRMVSRTLDQYEHLLSAAGRVAHGHGSA
ncbi:MAG: glycosyltransferase [Candidatus Schekmanbacteria bacterium]|nr:glycosyltransferase [Candidatus Schekmanbacteria bacterium]